MRISAFGHHAQVSILQVELKLLALARIEVDAPKSAQSDARRARDGRELQIQLYDFIAG